MAKKRGNGEGSIHRRKDGRWVGQYTVRAASGPKRKTVYGKTRAEVAAKLAKAIAESNDGYAFDAGNLSVGRGLRNLPPILQPSDVEDHRRPTRKPLCRGHNIAFGAAFGQNPTRPHFAGEVYEGSGGFFPNHTHPFADVFYLASAHPRAVAAIAS
jgi:hypothetical protein